MAGLIQTQQTAQISDSMLQKIIDGIHAKVQSKDAMEYQRIIVAGKKVMYSPTTAKYMFQQLHNPHAPLVQTVSDGISVLMLLLYKESNRQMQIPVAMLACIELMCDALDVAEKTINIKPTTEIVAACAHATQIAVLHRFGVTQAQIDHVVQTGQQQQGAK